MEPRCYICGKNFEGDDRITCRDDMNCIYGEYHEECLGRRINPTDKVEEIYQLREGLKSLQNWANENAPNLEASRVQEIVKQILDNFEPEVGHHEEGA